MHLKIQPTVNAIRSEILVPRALVGILILAALLITLFNLRDPSHSSAPLLAISREPMSNPPAKCPALSNRLIRRSLRMAQIAQTAQRAFLNSAIVILFAAVGMALSIIVQQKD